MKNLLAARRTRVALTALLQLGLLGAAVAAPLSARLVGREYLLRVAQADPIDPFRGAYVALSYPDLDPPVDTSGEPDHARPRGPVFVPLIADGEVWRGGPPVGTAPSGPSGPSGPYLRCHDDGWRMRCGIESWFLPEGKAAAVGRAVADGKAVAVVRIDSRGNAALVEVRSAA